MAQEVDRLQRQREIQNQIDVAQVQLTWADFLVKDWETETAGKPTTTSEREVIAINIARAKDARERLANLQAQAAALVAAK